MTRCKELGTEEPKYPLRVKVEITLNNENEFKDAIKGLKKASTGITWYAWFDELEEILNSK